MENANVGARKVYERIMRTCVSCNKPFSIPPAEQKFYEEKGMELPSVALSAVSKGASVLSLSVLTVAKSSFCLKPISSSIRTTGLSCQSAAKIALRIRK